MPLDPPPAVYTQPATPNPAAPLAVHAAPGVPSPDAPSVIYETQTAPVDGLLISGVVTDGVNGMVYPAGILNGKTYYTQDGEAVDIEGEAPWDGPMVFCSVAGVWIIGLHDETYFSQKGAPDADSPVGLTGWTVMIGSGQPTITDAPGLPAPPAIFTP